MKFSICIPNYNYSQYIRETLSSVLCQDAEIEVLVSDNCSNDGSIEVIEGIADPRVRVRVNPWNVGFAGNLDKACYGASGDRMILLSSDDLAGDESLKMYGRLASLLGDRANHAVFASDQKVIDEYGNVTGQEVRNKRLWVDACIDKPLSEALGVRVFRVAASSLLTRSLSELRSPFAFATTCYPRQMYEAVCGYGGQSLMNPDKVFAWKILSVAREAFYIEAPLFSYRVHGANQNSQQSQSGALKHLMDQYRISFNSDERVLEAARLDSTFLAKAFIEHDVALRGLKALAEGGRHLAKRHLLFGLATYPSICLRSRRAWMLGAALLLGPIGTWIANRRLSAALSAYAEGNVITAQSAASSGE